MNTTRGRGEGAKVASKQEEGSLCRLGYSVAAAHLPSLPLFSPHNEPGDIKAGTEKGKEARTTEGGEERGRE